LRRLAVALAAVALLSVSACADEAGEDPLLGYDPAFYVAPDPLPPGEPGQIFRAEQLPGAPGSGPVWRVLYRSTSLSGAPIAVSGIVAVPPGSPPAGGWPVLALAHGTVGIADDCAPSRRPGTTASEVAKQGVIVTATDYEGLGTEGRHPYLIGESEARGVIDSVRAARALGPEVGAGDRYAVVGYSQGGHAALFANQLASTWAPELQLVGTVAGAPVVELPTWLEQIDTAELGWLDAMVVAGFSSVDPAADPALVLTPDALAALPVVDDVCSVDLVGAFSTIGGATLARPLSEVPAFAALIARNDPGQVPGSSPLLVVHGAADDLIRPSLVDAAVARLCTLGQPVDQETYGGVGHADVIDATLDDAIDWIMDRFAGQAPRSVC
jgi:hypothetical protein